MFPRHMARTTSVVLRPRSPGERGPAVSAIRCKRKFLRFFPKGFYDETYLDWERNYKWRSHQTWCEQLDRAQYRSLLLRGEFSEIAQRAVRIESRTNLLFSFEKMALRDAVKTRAGARTLARGLFDFLYSRATPQVRFEQWCDTIAALPRRQTRVLTWPLVTVFGFIAQPDEHMFLKPNVTRIAAERYGFDFHYQSRPSWETYRSLYDFAAQLRQDLRDLRPRDLIDIQSFIWVLGSDEY